MEMIPVLEVVSIETREGETVDVYELRERPGGRPVTDSTVLNQLVENESWQRAMYQLNTPPKNGQHYPRIVHAGILGDAKNRREDALRVYTRHRLNSAPGVIPL